MSQWLRPVFLTYMLESVRSDQLVEFCVYDCDPVGLDVWNENTMLLGEKL